jgi:hypothetical protein
MHCSIKTFVKDECCGKCVQCFEELFFTSLPRHVIIQTKITLPITLSPCMNDFLL